MKKEHVRGITLVTVRELLGPAEGQYVRVFEETLTPPPVGVEAFCGDAYLFSLEEETSGICFELLRETVPTGPSQIGWMLYSLDTCSTVGIESIDAPDVSSRVCIPPLPAGNYVLGVAGNAMEGVWEYSLTIEAPGPLGIVMEADDVCGYAPEGCPDVAPAFLVPAK